MAMATALDLLHQAEIDGIHPNVFMYSAAIWTAEQCGDCKAALFLLDAVNRNKCRPNAVSYDGVISTLSQEGKFLEACAIFKSMKKDNIRPTAITFNKLAMAAQKCTTSSHDAIATALNDIVCNYLTGEERNASITGNI
eukprot:777583_1